MVRRVRQSPRLRPLGIAAYRAADRMFPAGDGPQVIANSMPKSGTHLLGSLLAGLPRMRFNGRLSVFEYSDLLDGVDRVRIFEGDVKKLRNNHFMGAHMVRDPRIEDVVKRSSAKLVTIMRDPRAVVVSGAHYIVDTEHMEGRDLALSLYPSVEGLMEAMVAGHGEPGDDLYFPSIGERFAAYAAWQDAEVGVTVTFEELVGGRGGGSDERQFAEVVRLLDYLGYADREVSSTDLAEQMFSERSATFRRGTIDSWRQDLPDALAERIVAECHEVMARLGLPV